MHLTTCDSSSIFLSLSELPVAIPVRFGNGQCLSAMKEGSVRLTNNVTLSNVLYVAGLNVNLIPIITPNAMTLRNRAHPKTIYCTAMQKDGLYDVIFPRPPLSKVPVTKADQLDIRRRLGHAGKSTKGKVIALGLGGQIRATDLSDLRCAACIKGKGMRLSSQASQ